ncbi:MAG: hypothetical protein V2B15_01180 [Bacteroidota bacterium]
MKYSSQTIYQTLLGCLRIWDRTGDGRWKDRAALLCEVLLRIQKPDGGFDIGYDFDFGRFHRKGQSTSPELVGLSALVEYYLRFGGADVARAAHRAADWIRVNSMAMNDQGWAIPYGPYSTREVMVYNGTSFAAGALGVYLSVFPDDELENIYHGMNKYLFHVLSASTGMPGKFWYYSDQGRSDLTESQRTKTDYYHQMQQVEMHAVAELCLSSPLQKEMIRLASEHVAYLQEPDGLVPYVNTENHFEHIHLWAYCSCASGFIMAGKIMERERPEYNERAVRVLNWILDHSWNGDYFYPIVAKDGQVVDSNFYVRSDAWVFNTFSLAVREGLNPEQYLGICEKVYSSLGKADFSGIENHASGKRIRVARRILINAAALKNRIWQK